VDWKHSAAGSTALRDTLMALIGEWGTGLDIALYREALEHFFNANHPANSPVQVFGSSGHLADQRMSLISPEVAFKLSAFSESTENLLVNARKLLRHTRLKAIQWANLTHGQITFTTILP
jgi:hypothetical protein